MDTVLIRKEEASRRFAGVSIAPRTEAPLIGVQRRGCRRLPGDRWNEERGRAGRRTHESQTGTYKLAIYPVGEDGMGDGDCAGRCELTNTAYAGLGMFIDFVADA